MHAASSTWLCPWLSRLHSDSSDTTALPGTRPVGWRFTNDGLETNRPEFHFPLTHSTCSKFPNLSEFLIPHLSSSGHTPHCSAERTGPQGVLLHPEPTEAATGTATATDTPPAALSRRRAGSRGVRALKCTPHRMFPSSPHPQSPEDDDRKVRRREKNRVAAQRSRKKQTQKADKLHEVRLHRGWSSGEPRGWSPLGPCRVTATPPTSTPVQGGALAWCCCVFPCFTHNCLRFFLICWVFSICEFLFLSKGVFI